MIQLPSIITFCFYLLFLTGIGIFFYKRTTSIEDYLLGGRGLGKWVTAFSAQASDMSGWLLMGLPGAVYLDGVPASWIAIGLCIGTFMNWKFISARLRIYTKMLESLTLPTFFENRFRDPTGLLRTISALITLVFFTIYASSGLVAAGRLFESMFHIDYRLAVTIGTSVIVLYTFLGGFLAVSWTDLFQGVLMVVAIVIVPILAAAAGTGTGSIQNAMELKKIATGLLPKSEYPLIAILSTMAWGLGYFGQPHILARFMGIRSAKELPAAMRIAMVWVVISLSGAVAVGLISIPMFSGLSGGNEEKVFIFMIKEIMNPWLGGIMLAAILSAVMSTIDSQLLVSSSSLTEDFYIKIKKQAPSQKERVFMGRVCVIIISIIAFFLALSPGSTVLGLVSYAWAGFGAAFGPLVIFALFSRKTGWQSALAGMIAGTVVLLVWKHLGLGSVMYEIVPGFTANCAVILVFNFFFPGTDNEIEKEFQAMNDEI